jgi:hypothetical protein
MQFILNGQVIELEDLDNSSNNLFIALHAAYLSNQPLNWLDFTDNAIKFFNRPDNSPSLQDKFFTNFTVIWRNILATGQLAAAEHIWQMALRPALLWEEKHKDRFIHKGTPFYFWGMTSILKGDLDKGFALIHQALEEDCRTSDSKFPDTPGFAFTTLNFNKTDQAFREWVLFQAKKLSEAIQIYSNLYQKSFTLEGFQNRFLRSSDNLDTIFFFVYTLARLNRIQDLPSYALASGFAGEIEINLLFDLSLVLDASVKAKNVTHWKFIEHAIYLSDKANLGLSADKLKEINLEFTNDFDQTLSNLLHGVFKLKNGWNLSSLERDISIAYGIRNRAAHNISSESRVWKEFGNIKQSLFNTLFLIVETLY